MKILVMGDMHGQCPKISSYLQKNQVDLMILTGDITHFGPEKLGESILNEICIFNTLTLAIPGNCDETYIYSEIESSNAINIHNKSLIIENIGVCGFGGSNTTPFNTPLEFAEIQIYTQLEKLMREIENQEIGILVTHVPPYNTGADILPSGHHAGSESVRKIIEEYQPALNVCGHIHEARAIDKIGDTIIINPGESSKGFAGIIEIESRNGNVNVSPELIQI